tara:strand:+ start:1174 stop:1665 length:492 start_codon:yes stop_codon:yes gene_type:complete
MATTTTITEVKRAFVDELSALAMASATAAAPTSVQVAYARPKVDQVRSEAVYFAGDMSTAGAPEQRLSGARRRREMTWDLELVVESAIISDSENAEKRAFVIVGLIEDWLASNAQPAEWSNAPVASGALFVLVESIRSELSESPEGFQSVTVSIGLMVKEFLV